jgi:hypothetical protein
VTRRVALGRPSAFGWARQAPAKDLHGQPLLVASGDDISDDTGYRSAREGVHRSVLLSAHSETVGAGARMPVATRKRERRGSAAGSRNSPDLSDAPFRGRRDLGRRQGGGRVEIVKGSSQRVGRQQGLC